MLIATIADHSAVEAVVAKGLKAGDPLDTDVGGLDDESAGQPVRIKGTITGVADIAGRHWVSVAFGRGNVVLISEYLTQVMDPLDLTGPGFTIDQFKVFAITSRVHFRRGFDDSSFAITFSNSRTLPGQRGRFSRPFPSMKFRGWIVGLMLDRYAR